MHKSLKAFAIHPISTVLLPYLVKLNYSRIILVFGVMTTQLMYYGINFEKFLCKSFLITTVKDKLKLAHCQQSYCKTYSLANVVLSTACARLYL